MPLARRSPRQYPSCSVSLDGIILANCFGCGRNGDVLSLIAAAHNLNLNDRRDFQKILSIGAEIAGLQPQNFLHQKKFHTSPIAINNTKETPIYPPEQEVINFWDECLPVNEDKDCWQIITSRFTEKNPVPVSKLTPTESLIETLSEAYQAHQFVQAGHKLLEKLV